jgi:hypothetical protein
VVLVRAVVLPQAEPEPVPHLLGMADRDGGGQAEKAAVIELVALLTGEHASSLDRAGRTVEDSSPTGISAR